MNTTAGHVFFRSAILLVLLVSWAALPLHPHLRFIGPNPYFSFLTFPQDTLLFPGSSSFLFIDYSKRGWLGNLHQPNRTPGPAYQASEENVAVDVGQQGVAEAGFQGARVTPSLRMAPLMIDLRGTRFMPFITAGLDLFHLSASGTAAAGSEGSWQTIPFASELRRDDLNYGLGVIVSRLVGEIPVGIALIFERQKQGTPEGFIRYQSGGSEVIQNRFNWGWSTVSSCSHIFGPPTTIDAFWQDEYSDTRMSRFDLTLGADLPKHRVAFHFRKESGRMDYYHYEESRDRYIAYPWGDRLGQSMFRIYDVIDLFRLLGGDAFLVALLEYDRVHNPVLYEGIELEDAYVENRYGVELLPFIHYALSDGGFLRIGTSISYFLTDHAQREIWGSQPVYGSGWTAFDWDPWWERSSYGFGSNLTSFSELNMELPLSERQSLVLISHLWSHLSFKRFRRFYGTNQDQGNGVYEFVEHAARTSTLNELWIGGTVGIQFGRKLSVGIFADLPIHYDVTRTTEISGADGEFFAGRSDRMPAIRQPVRLRCLVILNW